MDIGIYGGSFNPIHTGHTRLAQSLIHQHLVDEVWLLVSPLNPLKQTNTAEFAQYSHRLRMAELATQGMPNIRVSDFESHMPTPSYMLHTLQALSAAYPQHRFHLVIGADNWERFNEWYGYQEILDNYPLLVFCRPGYSIQDVKCVETPLYDISSTQLREAIRSNASTSEWLHPDVAAYIQTHHLFRTE